MDLKPLVIFVVCIGFVYAFSLEEILPNFKWDWINQQEQIEEPTYDYAMVEPEEPVEPPTFEPLPDEPPSLEDFSIMPNEITENPPEEEPGSTKLTYDDLYAEYFSYCYIYKDYIRSISLSTKNKNGTPIYVVSVYFEIETISLKHITKMDIGTLNFIDVEYKTMEEAKAMYDLLNADEEYPEMWFNTEECYYNYEDRKAPDGSKYAYCIVDPTRGKDQFRVGHDIT
ncbi:hypothetical protein KKB44_04380 [Candidatus Micrarchaeota archaeon]|nr:hypothetical protein [Candidatus Micrarchaeota archaeon]